MEKLARITCSRVSMGFLKFCFFFCAKVGKIAKIWEDGLQGDLEERRRHLLASKPTIVKTCLPTKRTVSEHSGADLQS